MSQDIPKSINKLHMRKMLDMPKFSPWLSLTTIILLQSISSTNTNFSAYSSQLKSHLNITQLQLNNLAVASDIGKLLAWCSGLAANHLPMPLVLLTGPTIGFIAYGAQFLSLSSQISKLTYWQFFTLQVLAGNSVCWINTACYVTALQRFPVDHTVVISLATSYTGLSAKIFITIAKLILGDHLRNKGIYLLLNCLVPIGVSLASVPFFSETEPFRITGRKGLIFVFTLAAATGLFSVIETMVPVLRNARLSAAVLLIMVGFLAGIALGDKTGIERIRYGIPVTVSEQQDDSISAMEIEEKRVGEGDKGVRELVMSAEFWLFFVVYLCGATLGLVYANNLGQIAQSRREHEAVLLSIYSSFGFFGKLATIPLSVLQRSKKSVSRPASVATLMVPMTVSFLLLLAPVNACLFISTAIIGLCTGAITSIAVSMTSDLFGAHNFSMNHNIIITNIPIGSILFGCIAALVYDRGSKDGASGVCTGFHCFRNTFIAWGAICSLGAVLSFVLYIRTKHILIQ